MTPTAPHGGPIGPAVFLSSRGRRTRRGFLNVTFCTITVQKMRGTRRGLEVYLQCAGLEIYIQCASSEHCHLGAGRAYMYISCTRARMCSRKLRVAVRSASEQRVRGVLPPICTASGVGQQVGSLLEVDGGVTAGARVLTSVHFRKKNQKKRACILRVYVFRLHVRERTPPRRHRADTLCAVNYFSCLELANSNTHTIETHEVHTRIMHISICGETRLYL